MDFFDLIFSNFFIVIIIVLGILRFVKGNLQKQQEEQQESRSQSPTDSRPARSTVLDQAKQKVEQVFEGFDELAEKLEQGQETTQQSTLKRQDELRKRAREMQQENRYESSPNYSIKQEQVIKSKSKIKSGDLTNKEMDIQLKRRLTQKGLIESVVMAEVLGAPRGLNRYRSVTANRNRS